MELPEKIKLELKIINAYSGNIQLVEKTIQFLSDALNELYDKTADQYKHNFKDVFCWDCLVEYVFKPCYDICYFSDRPLKIMRFIKWHLAKYELGFKIFIKDVMIEVLEDEYRMNPIFKSGPDTEKNIKHIVREIKKLDLNEPYKFEMVEGLTTTEYLNDGKNFYEDAKKLILIFMSIEGCILSEEEVHEKYINENFSPALIETIKKSKIAPYLLSSLVKEDDKINNNEEIETLKEIFYSKAIEKFIDIEKRFFEDGFIDNNCEWLRQKKELVALIHILNSKKYFKPISGKSKNNFFKYYRCFFENRYKIDIADMARPSKFPLKNIKNYEPTFHFIEAIN